MANVKITELSAIANPASTDVLAIVDITADITKKVTIADLLENAGDGSAAAPAFSFDSDTNTGVFLETADKLGLSTNGVGRIYIDATGNVGIAKSNPTQTLDVNGTAAVSGALTQGGNNVVTVGDTGTVTSTMIANGTIVDADVSATAEIAVSKLANGTARQLLQTDAAGTGVEFTSNIDVPGTLDVTGVATFDDNVTVGGNLTVNGTTTTIDSTTLVVEDKNIEMGAVTTPSDTTADGGGITLKGATDKTLTWVNSTDCWTFNQALNLTAGTQSAPALVFDADVNSGIFHPAANTIAASTNGSERLRITSSGSIGVGTSTPTARLSVNNNTATGNVNLADFHAPAANANGLVRIIARNAADTGTTSVDFFKTYQSGFGIHNNDTDPSNFTRFVVGASERMRINSSGNIGIGTSSPSMLLDVRGASDPQIKVSATNTGTNSAGLYIENQGQRNWQIWADRSSDQLRIGHATRTNTVVSVTDSRVGIGRTNPQYPLDVAGNIRFGLNTGYALIQYGLDSTNTDNWHVGSEGDGSFRFYSGVIGAGSEKMRINSNGNFGIGTSSPETPLHVDGTTATPVVFESSNSQSLINFRNSSTSLFFMGASSNNWNVQTNGVERLSVTTTGNVGVGTNSPDQKLDVNGGNLIVQSNSGNNITLKTSVGNANDSHFKFQKSRGGSGAIADVINGDDLGTISWGGYYSGAFQDTSTIRAEASISGSYSDRLLYDSDEHSIRTNNTTRVTINSSGNVGVGTSNPTTLLHIQKSNGSIINLGTGSSSSNSRQGFDFYGRFINGTTPALPGQLTSFIREERQGSTAAFDLTFGTGTSTDATEKVRIQSDGKVGVGTSDPVAKLNISSGDTGFSPGVNADELFLENTDHCGMTIGCGPNKTANIFFGEQGVGVSRGAIVYNTNGDHLAFSTAGLANERMRISGDGNVTIATTNINPVVNNTAGIAFRTAGNFLTNTLSTNAPHQFRRNTAGDLIRFHMNSTSVLGAIRVTSSDAFFDNNSDYRLKENVVDLDGAIDRVKQLAPKRFNFIADPDTTVDGFLAHEAQTVVPSAVHGTYNEVDEENNPVMQRIDQSKLVPLLTAALKEAITKIETLEQRLTDAGL